MSPDHDDSITVYDDSDADTPAHPPFDDLELGDSWRVKTVEKCPVCHTMTNKWVLGGYPSRGPRRYCPVQRGGLVASHSEPDEPQEKHDDLADLLTRREELESRLAQYDTDSEATERTVQRLHDELETIDTKIRTLRGWFDERFDDVEGVNPDRQTAPTFPERDQ